MRTSKKLRLGPLPKTQSTKLTFTCTARLKVNLDRYAALHAQTYGETVDAATLIPHMLEAFMAETGDSGKAQRHGIRHPNRHDVPVHHAAQQNAQITTARFALWIPRSRSGYDNGAG